MRPKTLALLIFSLTALNPLQGITAVAPASGKTPRIDKIVPDLLDLCSLQQQRGIVIVGDFPAGTRILLDGAGVAVGKAAEGEIVLALPMLTGGVHRVEAVAPGNRKSLPQAFSVETVPRITSVTTGEDQVTAYEVIVSGVNFLFESMLVVNGAALRPAKVEDPNAPTPTPIGGKDYIRYRDCSTLVYVRHPVTREPETVTLRVVNPGGEQSAEYEVTIP